MHTKDNSPQRRPAIEPPASPEAAGPSLKTIGLIAGFSLLSLVIGIGMAKPVSGLMERMAHRGDAHGDDQDHDHNGTQWYISGMHPWIIRPEPGFCPVCGMELTPLSPDMLTGDLAIDPQIVANIGVRIATAARAPFASSLHTVGTVEVDERLRREVVVRAPAFVERLHAQFIGQRVAAGEVLAEIHSPEIVAALNELLTLVRTNPNSPAARATRDRLRILGLDAPQIASIEASGEVPWTVSLKSRTDGVITALNGVEGQSLPSGGVLLEKADFSRVWVVGTVFESQLGRVREGMPAVVSSAVIPGLRLEGTVSYIYPTLNPQTRQGRLRVEVDNPDGRLKPGMFMRLEIEDVDATEALQVPREAVLKTGLRQIAYISRGDGRFEPREVRVGRENERGMVEVLSGLAAGDAVVVSGQFLLDSESRLRESLLKLVMGDTAAQQRVQAPVDAQPVLDAMPPQLGAALSRLLDAYLEAAEPLVHDHTDGIAAAARRISAAAGEIHALQGLPDAVAALARSASASMRTTADALATARSPNAARVALRDLSDPLRELLHATGLPPEHPHEIHEIRCPMFPDLGDMAWWFQIDNTTANPYMGQGMLTCHDRRFALPRTGQRIETPTATPSPGPQTAPADAGAAAAADVARGEVTAFPALQLAPAGEAALAEAIRAYLAIGTTLVGDSLRGVSGQAGRLQDALRRIADAGTAASPHTFNETGSLARSIHAAQTLSSSGDLDTARMAFAILGEELTGLLDAVGVPESIGDSLIAARCHMFPTFGENGWWIQVEGPLENPLWGPAMLRCADLRRPIARSPERANAHGDSNHD